jgi:hypothetical protein
MHSQDLESQSYQLLEIASKNFEWELIEPKPQGGSNERWVIAHPFTYFDTATRSPSVMGPFLPYLRSGRGRKGFEMEAGSIGIMLAVLCRRCQGKVILREWVLTTLLDMYASRTVSHEEGRKRTRRSECSTFFATLGAWTSDMLRAFSRGLLKGSRKLEHIRPKRRGYNITLRRRDQKKSDRHPTYTQSGTTRSKWRPS